MVTFSRLETGLRLIWTFTACAIHIGGSAALRFQVENVTQTRRKSTSLAEHCRSWIIRERVPYRHRNPIRLGWRRELVMIFILSWCLSTGTVVYIIWGALVLSSSLFISTEDAVVVVARYLASALVCTMVGWWECTSCRE
ncbi:hypothetical protein CC80DRAFT_91171 [Byssothecium circinans]|uniref:Uncharacterized protein n=1 Tax=Byssothecium circinans TaxID=147558 RepID=A0A6A5TQS0_9PLEO|nr:hypothetical protein CC80DRAFT_91171 [Byssothecium circinans]